MSSDVRGLSSGTGLGWAGEAIGFPDGQQPQAISIHFFFEGLGFRVLGVSV